jgi:D-tyrosyl-tRNA(Tyr) deacylase
MIVVVQRASRAEVRVDGKVVGKIELGLVVLVGVERGDSEADADVLARKLVALRIFPGKTPMDLSIRDVHGACLVVSQFTLAGSTRKGNRPSFDRAEDPVLARALYERMAERIRAEGIEVATGRFAADMKVELVNDGPVTFILRARDGALTGALTRE